MAKKRSATKELLIYIIVASIMNITRIAPKFIGYGFWKMIVFLFWSLNKKRREITINNLLSVYPDMSQEKAEEVGFQSVVNLIWMYTEFCWQSGMNKKNVDRFITYEGWEHLEKAYSKGKGVMLASMHCYNGELLPAGVATHDIGQVHWVIREIDNRFLDKKMTGIRESTGLMVVKKEKAMRKMIDALRAGEILAFTADQKASLNGVWVKFLGKWAATVKSPAVLHLRTGAPIVLYFSVPQPDGRHKAYFLPELEFKSSGDKKRDVFLITQMIADLQSEFVNKHPEIWLWMHRRWSIVPSDEEIAEAEELIAFAKENGYIADTSQVR